ncbi:MAG: Omp28-related outer membrane protein [Porphyromonadaceae bacterium]|nr:Omp28-related outer membrane protein [Porphyromonadaceae bacterium]
MKKIFATLVAVGALLTACDKNQEEPRWESNEGVQLSEAERRTVLIEEYTGQDCVNCPSAAGVLHKLEKEFPNNVIVVAMHSEHSGMARELKNAEATRLAKHFGLPNAVPMMMMNRMPFADKKNYNSDFAQWPNSIRKLVNTPKLADIELGKPSFDKAQDELRLSVKVKPAATMSDKRVRLVAWLVEDVVANQKLLTGETKKDYKHHNVLRKVLSDGDALRVNVDQEIMLTGKGLKASVKDMANAKVVVFIQKLEGSEEVLAARLVGLGDGLKPGPGSKPQPQPEPQPEDNKPTVREGISFYLAKTTVDESDFSLKFAELIEQVNSGHEFKFDQVTSIDEHYEFVTPNIFLHPGKNAPAGKYQIKIEKVSHKNDASVGLFSVCVFGKCNQAQSKEKHEEEITIQPADKLVTELIQIHYNVEQAPAEGTEYKLRVGVLDMSNKEVAHCFITFVFKKPTQ